MPEKRDPWQRPDLTPVDPAPPPEELTPPLEPKYILFWERLRRWGLGDSILRIATTGMTAVLILLVVWVIGTFYNLDQDHHTDPHSLAMAESLGMPTATVVPPLFTTDRSNPEGIDRQVGMNTILPVRMARYQVVEYTVESGDSIFSIADKFDIKPETILWGNREALGDDPHYIYPGQTLNILPVDGVYHQWSAGEGLNGVAIYYGVEPEDIINWPGNYLDPDEIGEYTNPNIPPDTMLVIPGGRGVFTDWRAPRIRRGEPATATHLGPGACTGSYDGVMGTLSFTWPTTERFLSGFDYTPETNHFGIDIGGRTGNPIFAADHGVVVYAGWNNFGYGEMIVIDHGSGWQTLYAHLSQVNVFCGQEVYQGDTIGLMGSTGKSSGPHLHFEMRSDDFGRVNPWNFLK
jgi:murein DD-endopeptidase MepM/ murein hydrolase activator NlpD